MNLPLTWLNLVLLAIWNIALPARQVDGQGAAAAWVVTAKAPDGAELPMPQTPATMAELLNRGKVSFAFYDAQREPRQYAGETRFDIQYRYQNLSRWQVTNQDGRRKLVIRSQFRQVELTWTHTISLPVAMANEHLYEQPLVKHELDHVRVSTHPALVELFHKWLKAEAEVLTIELAADQTPDSQWIQAQVKEATKPLFNRLMDLVRVRYQELDRVTSHGLYVVPDDFFPTPAPTTAAATR